MPKLINYCCLRFFKYAWLAMDNSLSFATKGQSLAVAAQYMPSGQQYQLGSGQHPPGHSVPPGQSFLAAIFAHHDSVI